MLYGAAEAAFETAQPRMSLHPCNSFGLKYGFSWSHAQDQSKEMSQDSVRFAWTRQLKQAWTRLTCTRSTAALFLPAGTPCPNAMIWAWEGYGECKPEEESAMKVILWLVSRSRQIFPMDYCYYLLQSVGPCFCFTKDARVQMETWIQKQRSI